MVTSLKKINAAITDEIDKSVFLGEAARPGP